MSLQNRPGNCLILHADDLGMNTAVNEGILAAFRAGLLTSTSLLSNAPAAEAAAKAWPTLIHQLANDSLPSCAARRELGEPNLPFDLGIHLNLTQGRPLTGPRYPAELLDRDGNFPGIGSLFFRLNRANSQQLWRVEAELRAQLSWMCDRNLRPSHLNGHQYVELVPQIAAMIPELVRRYAVPVVRVAREPSLTRNVLFQGRTAAWAIGLAKRYYASEFQKRMSAAKIPFPNQFFGTSHAGRVSLSTLTRFLKLAQTSPCTEIGLHPGEDPTRDNIATNDPWFDPLARLRPAERDWLCGDELSTILTRSHLQLGRLLLLDNRRNAVAPYRAAG